VFLVEIVKNYSFMLTLALMIISAVLYFIFSEAEDPSYYEIKVAKGDSLWSLAEDYKTLHDMDEIEFIKWVQDENDLITTKILPGEQLVIPVPSVKSDSGLQLADGE
jgi:LysM repeat protein